MTVLEGLLLLAKWGPQIVTLIKVLEGGKVSPQEATETILKLETTAVEAELHAKFPNEAP